MSEHETQGTTCVICPFCGFRHPYTMEWLVGMVGLEHEGDADCQKCGRGFLWSVELAPYWTTKRSASAARAVGGA